MEMLQLRYFYESAIEESFSKTAKKYMVPVSSVSASVKRLEQELGTELFVRTGNRVMLSDKGRQFLSVVGNTLSQLDMGVSALATKMTEKQTLTILARSTRETLVQWIASFHRTYPAVSFKLTFDDEPENYGNYDIIIGPPEDALKEYESFPWRRFGIQVEALDTDPLSNMFTDKKQMSFRGCDSGEFLTCLLGDVSLNANSAKTFSNTYETMENTLQNQRLSIFGVDQDEEALNLVQYQNAYTLASKMISTFAEVYDRLILETGV